MILQPDFFIFYAWKNNPACFLFDAYAFIYRAYYAFINRPMINSKGVNTSAIYGFTTTLMDILNRENPEYAAVVFDPPSPLSDTKCTVSIRQTGFQLLKKSGNQFRDQNHY